jgi:hypothetical protein
MKQTPSLYLALMLAALGTGCSDPVVDEPLAAPASATPEAVLIGIVEPGKAPSSPAPGNASESQPTTASNQIPEPVATEQTLHTVNMFLLEYQASGGQIPATIEEMVHRKIVPKLPPPPTGKRFAVDQQRALITFADI